MRRAVIDEVRRLTNDSEDLFTLETVLGELLGSEMERGHIAMAIAPWTCGVGGPVNLYTQGRAGITGTQGELRRAILKGTRIPMSLEIRSRARIFACACRRRTKTPFGKPGKGPA